MRYTTELLNVQTVHLIFRHSSQKLHKVKAAWWGINLSDWKSYWHLFNLLNNICHFLSCELCKTFHFLVGSGVGLNYKVITNEQTENCTPKLSWVINRYYMPWMISISADLSHDCQMKQHFGTSWYTKPIWCIIHNLNYIHDLIPVRIQNIHSYTPLNTEECTMVHIDPG